jgi:integrase
MRQGLRRMRFHDLRHSAATILLVAGVHPKVVQERMGHSSILITMDIYSHVLPSMQQEVADKIDDIFKRS